MRCRQCEELVPRAVADVHAQFVTFLPRLAPKVGAPDLFKQQIFSVAGGVLLRLRLSRTEQSFLSRDRILSVSRNPLLNCLGAQRPFPFANLRLTVHAPCNHEKT